MFKRRDRKSILKIMLDFFWPKGGWKRAFQYIKYRLRRLPDTPERIARGIWVGVFITFTPFYGLHFVLSAIICRLIKGNIIAGLLATFFGNPLTYIPIGLISLKTGHFILGSGVEHTTSEKSFASKFLDAGNDLQYNIIAIFTEKTADWENILVFYGEVFLPYLIGGILPGIIVASISYYISLPLILAYKKRRKGLLKEKFLLLKKKARTRKKDRI